MELVDSVSENNDWKTSFLDTEDGLAYIEIKTAYTDFKAKRKHPFLVMFQLEINEPNEVEHAEENEIEELNETESDLIEFLSQTQVIHLVGRITLGNWRDSLLYINTPSFDKKSLTKILDDINEDRGVNLSIEEDPDWEIVQEFL